MGDEKKNIKSGLTFDLIADTEEVDETIEEYKKIIDRIEYHFGELNKAINDLKIYKPSCSIKYELAASSNISSHELNDE